MKPPKLEPRCGSWVCTCPKSGRTYEFFVEANAQLALDNGFKVETALTYLARMNKEAGLLGDLF